MRTISAKRPVVNDGSNVNLRTLIDFTRQAHAALLQANETEAAHYFEMFNTYLEKDVANGKKFEFNYRVLGL